LAARDEESYRCDVVRAAVALGSAAVAALILSAQAFAVPPTLTSVSVQDRHPSARFSAPKADGVTIYLATKPDRATDGSFLNENIETLDVLTDAEIQAGSWTSESQVDPGTYYVMLRASPDFDLCWVTDIGGYDPSCADGYSSVVPLTVPKPTQRYVGSGTVFRVLNQASLRLSIVPLDGRQPYRVCYRVRSNARRCVRGSVTGFSWNSGATDTLTVSTRPLGFATTFSWFIGTKAVATKRLRTR
jgi:hypothetical protein